METISVNKGIHIIERDITQCDDEAIVNAANTGFGMEAELTTLLERQPEDKWMSI
jgi:hypothetical protein